ncbi:fork head domain protein, partial [Opisthorchis viverrini]
SANWSRSLGCRSVALSSSIPVVQSSRTTAVPNMMHPNPIPESEGVVEYDRHFDDILQQVDEFYTLSLVVRVFRALQRYTQTRGEKHILRLAGDLYLRKQTLQAYFQIWTWRMRTKLGSVDRLSTVARAHHEHWILQRFWHRWCQRVHDRRRFTTLCELANHHQSVTMSSRLLSWAFHQWLTVARDSHKANHFYRRKLLCLAFSSWCSKTQLSTKKRCQERLAIVHHKQWQQKYWFNMWLNQVTVEQEWLSKAEEVIRKRQLFKFAVFLHTQQSQAQFRLVKSAWDKWRDYASVCHRKEQAAIVHNEQRTLHLVSVAFRQWYVWATRKRNQRQMVRAHRSAMNEKLLRTMISRWHEYTTSYSRRYTQLQACFEAMTKLRHSHAIQQAFWRWRVQWKLQIADKFASRSLLQRSVHQWYLLHLTNIQKSRQYQSAVRFREITLKFRFLTAWSDQYKQARRLRQLDSLALCRWSCYLQARVWSAWLRWSNDRRRERNLRQTAIVYYRQRKTGEIFRAWKKKAVFTREQRQRVFCHHFWNSNFHCFSVAYKAATHWYHWTLKRRSKRLQEKESTKSIADPSTVPSPMQLNVLDGGCCNETATAHQHPEPANPTTGNMNDHTLILSQPQCPQFLLPYLHSQGVPQDVISQVSTGSCNVAVNNTANSTQPVAFGFHDIKERIDHLKVRIHTYILEREVLRLESTLNEPSDCVKEALQHSEVGLDSGAKVGGGSFSGHVKKSKDCMVVMAKWDDRFHRFSMTVKNHLFSSYSSYPAAESTMESCDCSPYGVDAVSTPNDLVSLAWLQKGDIIQIAPLDGEEEQQNGLESSTGSLSSLKSDDYPGFRTTLAEFTPFSIRSTAPSRTSIPSTTTAFNHPSTTDYGSVQCRIESSQLPHTSHLVQNNQGLTKPNYSYTHLIFMAIESTPQKCMTVNQIYNWCESNFPFYKHAGAGWKNSLRHNLSINKSFKRLPRDSRGPGRGAFWTVEPRERATLLDAIKRNPWNYNNMAALVSASSDSTGRASVPLMDFSSPQLLGMRRFGLSQSAPGHLLRTEGMGYAGLHFDPMGNLTDFPPGSGLRLLPTLDGHLVATFGNELQNSLLNSAMDVGDYDGSSSLSHDDFDVAIPGTPRAEGVSVPLDWSAEDEEKYQSTLRLLTETATPENDELSKSGAVEY